MILSPAGRVTVLLGPSHPPMTDKAVEELLASIGNDADAAEVLNPGFFRVLAAVARAWQAKMAEACQNGGGNPSEQHL